MKSAVLVSVLALTAFAVLEERRGSTHLPELREQKGRHCRRAERNYFIEQRREFWLLD